MYRKHSNGAVAAALQAVGWGFKSLTAHLNYTVTHSLSPLPNPYPAAA